MDFATLQSDFTTWVGNLATDRDGNAVPVVWGKQPQKIYTKPFILAYLGSITPQGQDIKTYEYDDLTDAYIEKMFGHRRATFRLSFRNFDQRLGYSARYYAERFRVRTQSSYGIESLPDPLGLISTGNLIELDYEWSGRMVNQVEMDVVLSFWMSLTDPDFSGGYIWNVNMEGQGTVVDEYQVPLEDRDEEVIVSEDTISINVTGNEAP